MLHALPIFSRRFRFDYFIRRHYCLLPLRFSPFSICCRYAALRIDADCRHADVMLFAAAITLTLFASAFRDTPF